MSKNKDVQIPRTLEEITKEYSQLCTKLGQSAYIISVHEKESKTITARLEEVNAEAAVRRELDGKAATEEANNG